jgi:6,7-dimethyl-8-ribityllumazine synthase
LIQHGIDPEHIISIDVPGAVELTYAAKRIHEQEEPDAVIIVGCVIQGETKHFDYVCQSVTYGVTELNLSYDAPTIFCVLTDNTIEQSRARSGGVHGNKGTEAAVAALKMMAL